MALVDNIEVNNVKLELHADRYGNWTVLEKYEDSKSKSLGQGDTPDKAKNLARIELNKRKIKVKVHFIAMNGESGVATGFHARTGAVLARMEDGQAEQFSSNQRVFSNRIDEDEIERYIEIGDEIKDLQQEQRKIRDEYEVVLASEVKQAIDHAMQKS